MTIERYFGCSANLIFLHHKYDIRIQHEKRNLLHNTKCFISHARRIHNFFESKPKTLISPNRYLSEI